MAMDTQHTSKGFVVIPRFRFGRLWGRRSAIAQPGEALRDALAREQVLLRGIKSVAEEYETLRAESDHRLLNGLQMIAGFLNMQALASDSGVKAQLAMAAQRVSAVERVHRRLHSNHDTKLVRVDKFLQELCADFSGILAPDEAGPREIIVACDAVSLPTPVAVPLGFIASELLTNAIKYGKGRIDVRLDASSHAGCALTISNDGPLLPPGFDPLASKGLGMRIVKSFVRQIGGAFRFGPGEGGQGAQFVVLIPRESEGGNNVGDR